MKYFLILNLFKYVLSGNNVHADIMPYNPIGNSVDDNNCLISAGYSWCESSQECIRQWITPCQDKYTDCNDCLERQRNGENIACPEECDNIMIQNPCSLECPPPVPCPSPGPNCNYIPPLVDNCGCSNGCGTINCHPIDPIPPMPPMPPTPIPIIFHSECPDVMCMMYCDNGFNKDNNNCNICECKENTIIEQLPCNNKYVCPKVTELYTDKDGYITYQLSLIINNNLNIKNIYAIYGDVHSDMYIPSAYQVNSILGKNIGGVNNYIINMNSETKYDSWLTIDITDGDPNNLLSTVGIDFQNWDENNGLTINNGAIFLLNPNDITIVSESIIGQLTIKDNNFEEMIINVQGKFIDNIDSWTQEKIILQLKPPNSLQVIPKNCIRWFDGCNSCSVNNSILGSCTKIMCIYEDTPYCEIHSNSLNGH